MNRRKFVVGAVTASIFGLGIKSIEKEESGWVANKDGSISDVKTGTTVSRNPEAESEVNDGE